jgi:DNA-directed RNA polymerase specialized sigma24 family protein
LEHVRSRITDPGAAADFVQEVFVSAFHEVDRAPVVANNSFSRRK